jgi:hypothetical protein
LQFLQAIRHAHLLDVLFVTQAGNVLVIGMPLCEQSLADRLGQCQQQGLDGIPPHELLEYLGQAADALDFLNEARHQFGDSRPYRVPHGNVKPHNLFVVGGAVRLGDFGLARIFQSGTGARRGAKTVPYTPPEMFQRGMTAMSDQYSLAVTYCQLRCGRLPFVGSETHMMHGHLTQPPDLQGLPPEERPAVARALAKDPTARWGSCREFVDTLKANLAPADWGINLTMTVMAPQLRAAVSAAAASAAAGPTSAITPAPPPPAAPPVMPPVAPPPLEPAPSLQAAAGPVHVQGPPRRSHHFLAWFFGVLCGLGGAAAGLYFGPPEVETWLAQARSHRGLARAEGKDTQLTARTGQVSEELRQAVEKAKRLEKDLLLFEEKAKTQERDLLEERRKSAKLDEELRRAEGRIGKLNNAHQALKDKLRDLDVQLTGARRDYEDERNARLQAEKSREAVVKVAESYTSVVTLENITTLNLTYELRWRRAEGSWTDWEKVKADPKASWTHWCAGGLAAEVRCPSFPKDHQVITLFHLYRHNTGSKKSYGSKDGLLYRFQGPDPNDNFVRLFYITP